MPSARPRSGTTGGGNVRGGFEGVVDPATRRALIDLRRQIGDLAVVAAAATAQVATVQGQITALIARVEVLEGAP